MGRFRGFSLVELLVVVAIVAILAAVAMPSYNSHVTKGYRSDAMGALVGFAQAMERHYTTQGTYLGAESGGDGVTPVTSDTAPDVFPTQAPIDGSEKYYNLFISAADATSYTITAKPITGKRMENDGVIGLTSTGLRGWSRDGDDDAFESGETCWEESC